MRNSILTVCVALALTACQAEQATNDGTAEIGASLTEKTDVAINDVPPAVLNAAQTRRPDLEFTSAEKEQRDGRTYYDIEGLTADGAEIELDIMQDGDGWTVVEVQRDIEIDATPELVSDALAQNAPGVVPDRIIESDQGDGVIIYEFFDRSPDGTETKYEVKYDGETAVFLNEEWEH